MKINKIAVIHSTNLALHTIRDDISKCHVALWSSHSDFPKENITFKGHLLNAKLVSINKT